MIKVSEETGVPRGIGEVVDQVAGLPNRDSLKEVDQLAGSIAGQPMGDVSNHGVVRPRIVGNNDDIRRFRASSRGAEVGWGFFWK